MANNLRDNHINRDLNIDITQMIILNESSLRTGDFHKKSYFG